MREFCYLQDKPVWGHLVMNKIWERFFHLKWKNCLSFHGFSKCLRHFWFNCPPCPRFVSMSEFQVPENFGMWGEGSVAHSILLEAGVGQPVPVSMTTRNLGITSVPVWADGSSQTRRRQRHKMWESIFIPRFMMDKETSGSWDENYK